VFNAPLPDRSYTNSLSSVFVQAKLAHLAAQVSVDWMWCANVECGELVIRLHETRRELFGSDVPQVTTQTWLGRPRAAVRPINDLIPEGLRRDFGEAAAILDTSPRMSAVLSRRILADVLEEYAGRSEFNLTDRIDAFASDTTQPAGIRENLHYLREMGNFGAHTQKNDQAKIIEIERTEAEWTLDVIERLFEHFIVGPERDRKMREGIAKKVDDAGRKAIPPLADESDDAT
jgi:hypothetical protein